MYCIDPDNIKHIHGYVKNKNEELVIGHCNQKAISYALEKKKEAEVNFVDFAVSTFDRVSKYFNTTLKRTSNIIYENTEFFNSLSNVDEVIIIGHSLNKVDMPYFEKVLKETNGNKIATAHTANDNAETVIMNIMRGSGTAGLKGIRPIRDRKFIRPLIEMTRDEIEN